jgi:hypothetical protein
MTEYDFDYTKLREYYTSIGVRVSDFLVQEYSADYVLMKYGNDKSKDTWKARGFDVTKLPDSHPLLRSHPFRFAYGCFVCVPSNINANDRKRPLYLIYPTERTVRNTGETILTGDHLTFFVNYGKPEDQRLQFHETRYIPDDNTVDLGSAQRHELHLPLSFPFSHDTLQARMKPVLKPLSNFICDMFSMPLRAQQPDPVLHTGGARRRRQPLKKNMAFSDIWRTLPIHKLLVVAIPSNENYMDVTIFVVDRFQHQQDWRVARFFRSPVNRVRDCDLLQADIARAFVGCQWDDFKDPSASSL